jgi:hypothetical protein
MLRAVNLARCLWFPPTSNVWQCFTALTRPILWSIWYSSWEAPSEEAENDVHLNHIRCSFVLTEWLVSLLLYAKIQLLWDLPRLLSNHILLSVLFRCPVLLRGHSQALLESLMSVMINISTEVKKWSKWDCRDSQLAFVNDNTSSEVTYAEDASQFTPVLPNKMDLNLQPCVEGRLCPVGNE